MRSRIQASVVPLSQSMVGPQLDEHAPAGHPQACSLSDLCVVETISPTPSAATSR